ncbi:hypothetical protein CR513_22468, partial [Mucuna pruriens]
MRKFEVLLASGGNNGFCCGIGFYCASTLDTFFQLFQASSGLLHPNQYMKQPCLVYRGAPWKAEIDQWLAACDVVH